MPRLSRKDTLEADQKLRELKRFKFELELIGNLNDFEIEELVKFEHLVSPISIPEQIRYYCLLLKNISPERAFELERMTNAILKVSEITERVIVELYAALTGFIRGFVLSYEGKTWNG